MPSAEPVPAATAAGPVTELLVHAARRGDRDAFARLYALHAGRVYATCLRMTGDAVEAGERTQDAFVLAWRRLDGFRGESAFGTWLHRIAVNAVLGEHRARGRRERRIETGDDPPEGAAPALDPAGDVDLERAIAGLPAGARHVFVLHDLEGYAHAEIAAMKGIATGTSKAQLHRARRLLRAALDR